MVWYNKLGPMMKVLGMTIKCTVTVLKVTDDHTRLPEAGCLVR